MKINVSKNKLIISIIFFIITLAFILLNSSSYIIDNSFNWIYFVLSILTLVTTCVIYCLNLNLGEKKSKIFTFTISFLSILFSYIVIELFNQNSLFDLYIKRLLFNFIVIIILHLFIYALSNSFKLTIILTNSLLFVLGIANYIVSCFRGTPLVPWDILSIKTAAYVADSYTFSFTPHFILACLLSIFIIVLGLKANYKFEKKKLNLILRFICIIVLSIITIVFYKTDVIDYFDFENNLWKPQDEYSNNGFLASFVKQSKNLFNETPENYSTENLESIISEKDYTTQTEKSEDDSPNIIVIMSESFSDLSVNGSFETSEEYMSYFYSLKENTIRGNTYVSVFGGQTPNSEWEFLTNNSMAFMPYRTVPYQQYIRKPSYSLAKTLKAQGYTANAIHPWYGSGYRRNAVYPLLGFDSFESLETLNDLEYIRKYPTDLSTYKEIIKQFENKGETEKIFNFTVTMQNHSGYDLEGYDSTVFLTDIENCPRVEQYLSVMKESDKALEYLINYFENYDEKTIILFFGDHQPPYFEDEFWETIMDDSSNDTTKYITPFLLWANYDIEEKYIEKISLNYLSILLLDTANLETTPYMNFLRDMQSEIPVITGNGYIDSKGNKYTFDDETKYLNIIKKYELIQYNNVFDYKNRINSFFEIN